MTLSTTFYDLKRLTKKIIRFSLAYTQTMFRQIIFYCHHASCIKAELILWEEPTLTHQH
jgi:hypothetical protein